MLKYLLLFLISVSSYTVAVGQDNGGVHRYSLNFKVDVPKGWTVKDDIGGMATIILSPRLATQDTFQENVNVGFEGVQATTLDEYLHGNLGVMQKSMSQFSQIAVDDSRIGNVPAKRVLYEHMYNGRRLRALMYALVAEGRGFVLTSTAPVDSFDAYLDIFERISHSFRLE